MFELSKTYLVSMSKGDAWWILTCLCVLNGAVI